MTVISFESDEQFVKSRRPRARCATVDCRCVGAPSRTEYVVIEDTREISPTAFSEADAWKYAAERIRNS